MRVSGIGTYTQHSVSAVRSASVVNNVARSQTSAQAGSIAVPRQTATPRSVLSQDEKQLFAQLFPDYAQQLRDGVGFNRQGQLEQVRSGAIGQLFDGRA